MKSPLKDARHKNLARGLLRTIITPGSRVNSYGIFSGHTELSLSHSDLKICCYTEKDVIYQFWECLCEDPYRLHSLLMDRSFKFKHAREFVTLQESLPLYSDSYIRSSLFFLLNRCSATGQVSCGEFDRKNYNVAALNKLKIFRKPVNFNVLKLKGSLLEHIKSAHDVDFILVPNLIFSYNLLKLGKSIGYDSYAYTPSDLKEALDHQGTPVALVFNKHPSVFSFFENFNFRLVGPAGRLTTDKDACEEIIVTNF